VVVVVVVVVVVLSRRPGLNTKSQDRYPILEPQLEFEFDIT
jgi:hypothetical protein